MDTTTITRPASPPAEPAHVQGWREQARELLALQGLPARRDEHWRRADLDFADILAALAALPGSLERPAAAGDVRVDADAEAFDAHSRLVFADGRFLRAHSTLADDDAACVRQLHAAMRDAPPAHPPLLPNAPLVGDLRPALLNHALGADGAHVVVRRDQRAARPIVLDHVGALAQDGVSAVSHAIRLEPGAVATLVEWHDDRCTGRRTLLSEVRIELGAGSRLLHLRLVAPTHASHLVDTLVVEAAEDAQYVQRALLAPARAMRSTQSLRLAGRGASVAVHVAALACRGADVDLRLLATHDADATRSEQAVHVLGGRGRATVDSEARVPAGRRAIRSRQSLRALLVQGPCDVALRPRLSILSDDVDCRHGATTSALSDEQLFYLRSRGLAHDEAQRLLAAAHLQQLFPAMGDEALDAMVQRRLQAALAAAIDAPDEDAP